jgi:putative membrane protein
MTVAAVLPSVNAALNATSAVLLVLGWRAIRRGARETHRRLMLAAFSTSTLFLACYLARVALTGTHRFPGSGAWKLAYLFLLASHTLLAAAAAPLAVRTLFLGLSSRFPAHRRLARATFPIWMFVSVSGVLVYVMLYRLAPALAAR